MTAKLLDGKLLSDALKEQMQKCIDDQKQKGQLPTPGLTVILVGNNPASEIYVKHKQTACKDIGIDSKLVRLPEDTTEAQLLEVIERLNLDPSVHGILMQMPLPKHLDCDKALQSIHPDKDVDGFHPQNVGRLALRQPTMRPCTPKGIMRLLSGHDIEVKGLEAVIVGASNIVGRPMALELLQAGSTVTVCHRFTQNLQNHVERADLLVVAAGKPGLIPGQWIKPGAIVIDVGINRLDNGRITGDVQFEQAAERAAWISPVPGGVGPMTVSMLMENTLQAAGYTTPSQ